MVTIISLWFFQFLFEPSYFGEEKSTGSDRFITTKYDTQWIGLSLPPLSVINHAALVWFERKSTRNHGFKSQIWCVPCLQLLPWTNFERLISSTEILRDFLKWVDSQNHGFQYYPSFGATIWMAWLVVLLHYASTMRLEWCMLQWSNKHSIFNSLYRGFTKSW